MLEYDNSDVRRIDLTKVHIEEMTSSERLWRRFVQSDANSETNIQWIFVNRRTITMGGESGDCRMAACMMRMK
jgi:hypothetical protein